MKKKKRKRTELTIRGPVMQNLAFSDIYYEFGQELCKDLKNTCSESLSLFSNVFNSTS